MRAFEPRDLVRGMAPLLAGAGAAQVVAFAALPVLTRVYDPAAFGALAFFGAAAMLAGLWICGRYELAVPIPEDDRTAKELLSLATILGIAAAVLSVPAALGLRDVLGGRERFADVTPWLVWIPPSLFLTSLYQPLSYWFTRRARFRAIALTRALQSATTAAAQIGLGVAGALGPAGLVAGALAGQAAATLALEAAARRDAPLEARLRGDPARLRAAASRYREFPLFTTPAGLLQLAAEQLPLLLVPALFGLAVAGAYALPARLLQALVLLVAAPAAQVFYPLAARRRGGDLAGAALRTQRMLLAWTLAPSLVVAAAAGPVFATLFGGTWRASGAYFVLLLPWFATAVPFAPLSQLPLVLERPRTALLVHLAVLVASIGGLLAAAPFGAEPAILTFAAAGGAARLVSLEIVLRGAGAPPGAGLGAFAQALRPALPAAAAAWAAARFLADDRLVTGVAALLVLAHAAVQLRGLRRDRADA